jgi:hypothetical protein
VTILIMFKRLTGLICLLVISFLCGCGDGTNVVKTPVPQTPQK